MSKVKVAVRVRPMNKRELSMNAGCVVDMEGNQTILTPPEYVYTLTLIPNLDVQIGYLDDQINNRDTTRLNP
jgi:hypothetical protein